MSAAHIAKLLFSLEGRIGRGEFWLGLLLSLVLLVALIAVGVGLGIPVEEQLAGETPSSNALSLVQAISFGYVQLALCVKRYRDRGKVACVGVAGGHTANWLAGDVRGVGF